MFTKIILSILFIASLSDGLFSQTAKPPTKSNVRPAEKPVAEPYEKATVAEMATKCVALDTEAGMIEIELYPESAPESVRNFLNITALSLYDTTTFARVVPGFVIQGGNAWTRDTPVTHKIAERANRSVPDEPNKILHERGVVSLAKTDEPNSANTNFFILVDKAPYLDNKFAAFGRVTKGMETVDAINKAAVKDEKPDKPVKVKTARITVCTKAPTQ